MNDFFNWSGWIFGVVGVIFGVFQLLKKNDYKKKLISITEDHRKIKEEYNNIKADNGSIAVGKNTGGMHFNK